MTQHDKVEHHGTTFWRYTLVQLSGTAFWYFLVLSGTAFWNSFLEQFRYNNLTEQFHILEKHNKVVHHGATAWRYTLVHLHGTAA